MPAITRGTVLLAAAGAAVLGMLVPRHGAAVAPPAVAAEAVPARSAPFPGLRKELRRLARRAPARAAAIFVQDTRTGKVAALNPDRPFIAASLIKLPVMAAVYARWERSPRTRTESRRAWTAAMITLSDNACTDRMIDFLGGPEVVTRYCRRRGWDGLRLRHAILNHGGRRGINTCTAREVTALLTALDRRELVSPAADAEMWSLLRRQTMVQRIPAGLPQRPGLEVGNKTGTLRSVLHDAAIVHAGDTRYALCILLSRPRSEEAGDRFCREVSATVFRALCPVEEPRAVAQR
ncbi:MAG TPA: serine hydrolase [Armatimonadota bacterium]|nr:serine hydrolase [Armatimonadota bacterium]